MANKMQRIKTVIGIYSKIVVPTCSIELNHKYLADKFKGKK